MLLTLGTAAQASKFANAGIYSRIFSLIWANALLTCPWIGTLIRTAITNLETLVGQLVPSKNKTKGKTVNNQKPEGPRYYDGTLDVHSFFYTIQGEGPFAGHRAVFVRLAGCNLQCPGCDTEYTEGRAFMTPETAALTVVSIVDIERDKGAFLGDAPLVVITGGEPLRQQIGPLVHLLLNTGFRVQIESNGFFAPDETLQRLLTYAGVGAQWQKRLSLVISPKTSKISTEARVYASAFKYVIDADSLDPNDGLPIHALSHPGNKVVARPLRYDAPIYVNPCDRGDPVINQRNLEAAAASAKKYGYILGVQIHKLVGLE